MEIYGQEQPVSHVAELPSEEEHESYFQLVWTRFRRSKPAIVGGLMIIGLAVLAIFSDFFSKCVCKFFVLSFF